MHGVYEKALIRAFAKMDRVPRAAFWGVHLMSEGDNVRHEIARGGAEPTHRIRVTDPYRGMDEFASRHSPTRRSAATTQAFEH